MTNRFLQSLTNLLEISNYLISKWGRQIHALFISLMIYRLQNEFMQTNRKFMQTATLCQVLLVIILSGKVILGKKGRNIYIYNLGKMFLPMFTKVFDNFHLSSFFFSVKFLVPFLSKKFARFSDFILFKIKAKIFGHKQGLITP